MVSRELNFNMAFQTSQRKSSAVLSAIRRTSEALCDRTALDDEICPRDTRARTRSLHDAIDMQVSLLIPVAMMLLSCSMCQQRMGKRQELQRKFQYLSTIGFASCVLGT